MKAFLKIKIKSLAEEAKIIRLEERKYKKSIRYNRDNQLPPSKIKPWIAASLHSHRTYDVRKEARAAQLAYGFLRNKSLKSIEPHMVQKTSLGYERYDITLLWKRVDALVVKYGTGYGTDYSGDAGRKKISEELKNWRTVE